MTINFPEQTSPDRVIRVFLSYARGDDEPFVKRLHADLVKAGFTVWFDRVSLPSRQLTFHQEIKDAILKETDRLIYVGGPKAALSDYVRAEWQFALECDRVGVTPILRLGDYEHVPGELSLLHCEDFRDDANYPAALAKLIASLRQPNPKLGALFAVPNLPPNFLGRPDLMRRVRDALLVDLQTTKVITGADARVGMQGMGGIGKSVLAAALARNRQVRQAYPDGVVWIAAGQKLTDDDLLKRQRDLARHLGGDDTFASLAQGQGVLRQLLAAKAVLLVLDDVWRAADAQAFDVLGPRCRMLVTTRDKGILDALHGELVPVSLFTEPEALQLLADVVNVAPAALPAEAREVARECGLLPLALALCGGMARKRGGDFHSVLERLRRADLEKIADRESINEQHRSIWRAMQASVEMLPDNEQQRFAELSVFATDQTVPEAAAATLWSHTGDLADLDTEELLINLAERSLLQLDQKTEVDGKARRRFRLHDLLHDYAVRIAGEPRAVHQKLLDAYRKKCPYGWPSGPDDGYFFQNLCQHLATAAGNWDETVALLCDLRFVEARCRVGQVFELIADYRLARENLPEVQADLCKERAREERVGRWTDEIIKYARQWSDRRDRTERGASVPEPEPKLPEPMPGCEMWSEERIQAECKRIIYSPTRRDRLEAFAGFVTGQCYPLAERGAHPGFIVQHAFNAEPGGPVHAAAKNLLQALRVPHLLRRWPADASPNLKPSLLRTLKGHNGWISSVSVTPDGRRAVSGSDDTTVRVWDLESGVCFRILEGHSCSVTHVSVTPDGRRAISCANNEETARVWDLENGACLRTIGSVSLVTSVTVTPDGRRAVSGSADNTVRVWDIESGACIRTLEVKNGTCVKTMEGLMKAVISSVSVTPDGRFVVSGSLENTVRVWDLESGACIRTLEGHSDRVFSVSVTPNGQRAVSGSWDNTVRVWDLESGKCLRVLEGHGACVRSVSVTPDGRRAVSGSWDNTVRVWDLESGACLPTPESHSGWVKSISVTPDERRAVSGSGDWDGKDKTVRIWDVEKGSCLRTLEGHKCDVYSVAVTPDGRRAVSIDRKEMRLWDLVDGSCLRTLEGHSAKVWSISLAPDNRRAVTGSGDNTVRVWDIKNGTCLQTLKGHSYGIRSVSVTPDGRFVVSGGGDKTIRVWDLQSGSCLRTLKGHSGVISSVSVTPDGRRVVSGSWDKTIRVWDLQSGACLRTLEDHRWEVRSVSVTPDGRRAVSMSQKETVRVWDLESGACLRKLELRNREAFNLDVTRDGRRAVETNGNTISVWDPESGACLAVFAAAAPVYAVAISFTKVVIGTSIGTVLFVDICGLEPGPDIKPDASDEGYEQLLRRGLAFSRREKGAHHEETLAHLAALAAHFEQLGQPETARPFAEEHARSRKG